MADCCVAVASTSAASSTNNFTVNSSADGASSVTAAAAAVTTVGQKTSSQPSTTSVQRQATGQKYSATELLLQRSGSTASDRTRSTGTNNNDNRKKKKKKDSKEKRTEKTTAASTATTASVTRRPLSLSVGRLPNYAAPTVSSQLRCLSVQAVHYKHLQQDVDGSRGSPRHQQHCSRGRATAPTSPHVHICPRFQPPPTELTPFRSRSKSVAMTSRASSVDQRLKALQLHSGGKSTPETARTTAAAAASGSRKTVDSSAAAGRRSRSVDGRLRAVRGDTVTLSVFAPAAATGKKETKMVSETRLSGSRNVDRASRRAEPTDAAKSRPTPRRDVDTGKQKSRLLAVADDGKLQRSRSADRRGLTTATGRGSSGAGSSSKDGQRRTLSTDSRSVKNSTVPAATAVINRAGNTGTGSADVRQATANKPAAGDAAQTRGRADTTSKTDGAKDEEQRQSIRKSAQFNSQKSEQNLQTLAAPYDESAKPQQNTVPDQHQQQQQQPAASSKQSEKQPTNDNNDTRGSADEYKLKLAEKRRQAREAAQREAQLEQERAEKLRLEQEEARRVVEAERRELLERLEAERRRLELEETKRREQQEIEEREENERKQRELVEKLEQEQREKQLAEEKARVETEQREAERLERMRLDEEERLERKRKLALIMQRVKVAEGTSSPRSTERSASGDRASECVTVNDNKHTTTTTITTDVTVVTSKVNANSMSAAELLDMTNSNA